MRLSPTPGPLARAIVLATVTVTRMSLPFMLRGGRAAPGRFSKPPLFKDTHLEGHCRWHARARTRRLTGSESLRRLPGPRPQAGQQYYVGTLLAFLWGDG